MNRTTIDYRQSAVDFKMTDLLIAKNLHKSYYSGRRELHVIKGIDLSIREGELLFIVGPSGAGKSTLLHILAGLDRPDEGEVIFNGTTIYKLSDKKSSNLRNKNIGVIFQFYNLLPEFTAIENVILPGLIEQGCDTLELKKKARDTLSRLNLSDKIDNRPAELSGGEQQRVAIARALINSPDILFCDEPTGNLDSENSKAIYNLIFDLNKRDKLTVMIVTHQRDFSDKVDRCLLIKDGILSPNMIQ
jgi:lipoprotein-releasing system ATP-binding protein